MELGSASLKVDGCDTLDNDTLTEILDMELGAGFSLQGETPVPRIALACEQKKIRIGVHDDSLTVKIERTIPNPGFEQPGAEREIAIAVAQFVLGVWEAVWEDRKDFTGGAHGDPLDPSLEVGSAPNEPEGLTTEAGLGVKAEDLAWLSIDGIVRMRSIAPTALWVTGGGRLGLLKLLGDRIGLGAVISLEGGRARRRSGDVDGFGALGGLEAIFRLVARSERFDLDFSVGLAAGYGRLVGRAIEENVVSGLAQGLLSEGAVRLVPCWSVGKMRFRFMVEAGYALATVNATVYGEEKVTFGGLFVGAGLGLAFIVGAPDQSTR